MKDASIKHIFRIAVFLKVPLYLAARYLVDYSTKHSALHLFLCELKHLSQHLRPLRTAWQMKAPDAKLYILMGIAASEHLLGCLAGILLSSVLALGCSQGGSPAKSQRGFVCLPFAFWMQFIFYLFMTEKNVHLLNMSLH